MEPTSSMGAGWSGDRERLKVFEALYDLALMMTADHPLEETLEKVVRLARDTSSADTAYLALRDEARGDVYMHTLLGITTEAFKSMRIPFGTGLGGRVALSRTGFIVEDYFATSDIPKRVVDDLVMSEGLISGMAAPIQMGAQNLGVLYVFNRRKTRFTQADLNLLFLIANLAAVAISHRNVEGNLKALHQSLEAIVAQRTQDLADAIVLLEVEISERKKIEEERFELEGRLRQAQKMEAIGRLAGGIAHDFNNLLTAIIGYAQIAESKLFPGDPLKNDLTQIRAAGERAASLTQQLLAFSRQQVLKPNLLNIAKVVSSVKELLTRLLGEQVSLAIECDENLPPVLLDQGQFQQVILNLAVNARDAMPRGGSLSLRCTRTCLRTPIGSVPPGDYIAMIFSDTGTGMDEATKLRIFDPFFTTKALGKGTGLGLSTVHGIIGQSGGHITVDSVVGQGTVFTVYFPVSGEASPAEECGGEEALRLEKHRKTVLVVEDEDYVLRMVIEYMNLAGFKTFQAQNGEEALEVFKAHANEIDLLLTDVVMPGMNGRELAETLLAIRPGLKVLYMSGYTEDDVVRHGISHDQIDFIQKPFLQTSLLNALSKLLS